MIASVSNCTGAESHAGRGWGVGQGGQHSKLQETIAENQLKLQAFNIAFACVIACGVVYNTARISQPSAVENWRPAGAWFFRGGSLRHPAGRIGHRYLVGHSLGLAIGNLLTWLTTLSLQTEMYRIPFVVSTDTWLRAVGVVLLATAGSSLVVQRVKQLDLIGVLKSPE